MIRTVVFVKDNVGLHQAVALLFSGSSCGSSTFLLDVASERSGSKDTRWVGEQRMDEHHAKKDQKVSSRIFRKARDNQLSSPGCDDAE